MDDSKKDSNNDKPPVPLEDLIIENTFLRVCNKHYNPIGGKGY